MKEIFRNMVGRSVVRKRQITTFIPEVLKCETMLYIGASPARFELVDLFTRHNIKIDVMEIWHDNVEKLRKINAKYKIFQRVIHGNVVHIERFIGGKYDVICWWHGPEHIEFNLIAPTLAKLEDWASAWIILGCPWGEFPQGAVGGNPHEEHICSLYPKFFQSLGYATLTIRKPGKRGSNILAWKNLTR